jgi:hypothetical protein
MYHKILRGYHQAGTALRVIAAITRRVSAAINTIDCFARGTDGSSPVYMPSGVGKALGPDPKSIPLAPDRLVGGDCCQRC